MKVILAVCLMFTIRISRGGLVSPTLVHTAGLDTAIVQSHRFGGNFAYSTIEGHAYAPISSIVAAPIAHLPLIHHKPIIAAQPIFPSPGIIAEAPIVTNPIAPALPDFIAQAPVVTAPFAPVNPGIIAQAPAVTAPIAPAPISAPIPGVPSSVVVDEDTVAVESA